MVRGVTEASTDPDLEEIVRIWPGLPEHIKAAIKALVQTHEHETEKR